MSSGGWQDVERQACAGICTASASMQARGMCSQIPWVVLKWHFFIMIRLFVFPSVPTRACMPVCIPVVI